MPGASMDSDFQAFKEIIDKAPTIIAAVKTPLGLAATAFFTLGIVGAVFFRKSTARAKLLAFAALAIGTIGIILVTINVKLPPPAFDLDDNAKTTISGTTISGNPSGIVKQRGNSEVHIQDSLIEGGITSRTMPPTSEENSRLSKEELLAKERAISDRLRVFQSDTDTGALTYMRSPHEKGGQDGFSELALKAQQRYQIEFKEKVDALAGELSRRIGSLNLPPTNLSDPKSYRQIMQLNHGAAIISSGKFVGPSPAQCVADFLDFLAARLAA